MASLPHPGLTSPFLRSSLFIMMASTLALLSYAEPSLQARLWVGTFGLLLPLILAFRSPAQKDLLSRSAPPSIPLWAWALPFAVGLPIRFIHLENLSTWPLADEGFFNYFPLLLQEKWDWELLEGPYQQPTLFAWGQGLLFKLLGPSLGTLWLFPALLSSACLVTILLPAKVLPHSISFSVLALTATGFWPLYVGRVSGNFILMLWMEFVALALLALYLTGSVPKKALLVGLAVWTGLGFYTYFAWPLVAAWLLLGLCLDPRPGRIGRWKAVLSFATISGALLLPLLLAYAKEYRGYFHHLWAFHPGQEGYPLRMALAYLSDIFLGKGGDTFRYGPLSGGLLNPLCGALVLWGTVAFSRMGQKRWVVLAWAALVLFSLPLWMTRTLELMRLVALIPIFLLLAVVGLRSLLLMTSVRRRVPLLLAVLLGSAALDLRHLFFVLPSHWAEHPAYYGDHKSVESFRAYNILRPLADREGPGLILLNFHPDPVDQTLLIATYPFNAMTDPRSDLSKTQWAAVLVNVHEEPFLRNAFPGGHAFPLSEGLGRRDGGLLLWISVLDGPNRTRWERWSSADKGLRTLTYWVMELGVTPRQDRMMEALQAAYVSVRGDPLLESRYWRIKALHHLAEGKRQEALGCLEQALSKGHPMAHLYSEKGKLLFAEGNVRRSEQAFRKALSLRPNLTDAGENLGNLLAEKERPITP